MLFDTTEGPSLMVEQPSPKMNCHGPTYETVLWAPTSQKYANDICSTQSSGHCIVVINHEQWKISARLVHLNLLKSSIFQFHFRLTFIVWLMQGILAVTFWHSAMAASGGSKVTYGAMKCALSKARGGTSSISFFFRSWKVKSEKHFTQIDSQIHSWHLTNWKVTLSKEDCSKTAFAQSRTMHKIRNEIEFEKAKSKMEILQSYLFL